MYANILAFNYFMQYSVVAFYRNIFFSSNQISIQKPVRLKEYFNLKDF